eukprot:c20481_g1_i7.p1 GENE.c20481_g1_i7~~c20481_g1_i7.p1  ORF type:complete len:180 (+),score=30.38 c20481_g1_i7:2-541(+)
MGGCFALFLSVWGMDEFIEPYRASRAHAAVLKPCCRLLAGLQHIIDWRLEHSRTETYTLGALMHSIKEMTTDQQLSVISYFHTFVQSVLDGERIRYRSSSTINKIFRSCSKKYPKRMALYIQITEFIMGHLRCSGYQKLESEGPFPRLNTMQMPVFETIHPKIDSDTEVRDKNKQTNKL